MDRWLTAWNPNSVSKGTVVRNSSSKQIRELKSSVSGMAVSSSAGIKQSGKSSNDDPGDISSLRYLDLIVFGADLFIRIRTIPIQQVCIVHLVL